MQEPKQIFIDIFLSSKEESYAGDPDSSIKYKMYINAKCLPPDRLALPEAEGISKNFQGSKIADHSSSGMVSPLSALLILAKSTANPPAITSR